ncbi:hypothetical protein, partial [Mesorhizobium sp. M4A.F.Ca.ET.022.05.2.1]|uniref:hypothetical protein n=1 Tax=Mesorhizobium sp. M4A.F.Ca.ET.022.05.2.1 TaxID=2496653 RepID=UPI001AED0A33
MAIEAKPGDPRALAMAFGCAGFGTIDRGAALDDPERAEANLRSCGGCLDAGGVVARAACC